MFEYLSLHGILLIMDYVHCMGMGSIMQQDDGIHEFVWVFGCDNGTQLSKNLTVMFCILT
jgi:hypothetical protein